MDFPGNSGTMTNSWPTRSTNSIDPTNVCSVLCASRLKKPREAKKGEALGDGSTTDQKGTVSWTVGALIFESKTPENTVNTVVLCCFIHLRALKPRPNANLEPSCFDDSTKKTKKTKSLATTEGWTQSSCLFFLPVQVWCIYWIVFCGCVSIFCEVRVTKPAQAPKKKQELWAKKTRVTKSHKKSQKATKAKKPDSKIKHKKQKFEKETRSSSETIALHSSPFFSLRQFHWLFQERLRDLSSLLLNSGALAQLT